MMKRLLLPALVVGLGFGLLAALSSPAAGSAVAAEKITKLIGQMGSDDFEDREAAQKQLDAIGEPALDALKKALSSEDTEIRRRAEELVKNIEQRTESAKVLQATKIHLVYKDTPLAEAIADFRKKSGFNITLHDPDGKLKDRKITLDTGETVFWTAFDKFCAVAKLVEAKQEDLIQQPQPGQGGAPGAPGAPGVAPNPPPIRIQPAQPVPPARTTPAQPAQPQKQQLGADEAPAQQVRQNAAQQPAVKPAQPPVAQPPVAQPGVIIRGNPQPVAQLQPGQIVLKDGKPKDAPTDYSTAIRVRAMEKIENVTAPEVGQIVIGLQVSPEPKITWQNLIGVTITKAVDDKDQTLAQAAVEVPDAPAVGVARPGVIRIGAANPGWNATPVSLHQEIPVYLKKGAKNTKSLKELTGVIKAQVLTPAKAVITTDDVFKSANKTFQGGDKGSIKILEATKAENGQVRVRFDMQMPQDVVPANTNAGAPGAGGAVPPQGKAQKLQVQAQQAALVRPIRPIQQVVTGLEAIDDKGNVIPVTIQQQWVQDANGARLEYIAIFQLPKEQQVAKLVYSGSRSVTVEIPFTLKDVMLP